MRLPSRASGLASASQYIFAISNLPLELFLERIAGNRPFGSGRNQKGVLGERAGFVAMCGRLPASFARGEIGVDVEALRFHVQRDDVSVADERNRPARCGF